MVKPIDATSREWTWKRTGKIVFLYFPFATFVMLPLYAIGATAYVVSNLLRVGYMIGEQWMNSFLDGWDQDKP